MDFTTMTQAELDATYSLAMRMAEDAARLGCMEAAKGFLNTRAKVQAEVARRVASREERHPNAWWHEYFSTHNAAEEIRAGLAVRR